MSLLPAVPRLPSARNKIADFVFVALAVFARSAFALGGVAGAALHGLDGCLAGLAAGVIIGSGAGRSLGIRGSDATHAFYHRMHVRGTGRRAGWLETLVELIRGNRLSMIQCRAIACAYAETGRHLQICNSTEERNAVILECRRKILAVAYGEPSAAGRPKKNRDAIACVPG